MNLVRIVQIHAEHLHAERIHAGHLHAEQFQHEVLLTNVQAKKLRNTNLFNAFVVFIILEN